MIKEKHPSILINRAIFMLMLVSIIVAISFAFKAMQLYPGGNSVNNQSIGYDLLHNYWCDLLRPTALNGVANQNGSRIAKISMLVMTYGTFLPCCYLFPMLFNQRYRFLVQLTRWAGIFSVPGITWLALHPTGIEKVYEHAIIAYSWGIPAMVSMASVTIGFWFSKKVTFIQKLLGPLFLISSLTGMVLYIPAIIVDMEFNLLLVSTQRIAMVVSIIWIIWCGFTAANLKTTDFDVSNGI